MIAIAASTSSPNTGRTRFFMQNLLCSIKNNVPDRENVVTYRIRVCRVLSIWNKD
jgi:hypothetical protein